MEDWWIVLVVLILAALGIVYALRRSRQRTVPVDDVSTTPRDFIQERETARMGNLSEEERDWQAASIERERASKVPKPPA